jgi:hypothetical protein
MTSGRMPGFSLRADSTSAFVFQPRKELAYPFLRQQFERYVLRNNAFLRLAIFQE